MSKKPTTTAASKPAKSATTKTAPVAAGKGKGKPAPAKAPAKKSGKSASTATPTTGKATAKNVPGAAETTAASPASNPAPTTTVETTADDKRQATAFKKDAQLLTTAMIQAAAGDGPQLSLRENTVMLMLYTGVADASVKGLADGLRTSRSAISRLLKGLQAEKLTTSSKSEADLRDMSVGLTPEGEQHVRKLVTGMRGAPAISTGANVNQQARIAA